MYNRNRRRDANDDNYEPVDFKRVVCVPLGKSKDVAISLASSKLFSLTQFLVVEFDDQKKNRYAMPGSLRLKKSALITLHKMLTFVLVRLKDNSDEKLNETQLDYIERMKDFWTAMLDDEVAYAELNAGYSESNYDGETYNDFDMPIETIRR